MLKNVDDVIVLSENVYNIATKMTGKNIIKLFHPLYETESLPSKEESFASLKIPPKKSILFFGYIKAYKGLDIFIKAVPLVTKKFPDVQFIIAGEVYGKSNVYDKMIEDLATDNLIFRNQYIPVSEIPNLMNIADIVVAPYRTATQSGIIQLAYSYQKPVIASDIAGLREMVLDGQTGYLFQSENEVDLADKIIKSLSEETDFTENISKNNQKFTWDAFVSDFFKSLT
jgi:glycosyltransferase involved in cell wall biosynthesis